MKVVFKLEEIVVRAEKAVLVTLIFFMIGLSFLQIIMRTAFSSGFIWADPLLRHMVLWVGMLGAALASRYGKHFTLDIAVKLLPAKSRRVCEISAYVFTMAVCVGLFEAAFKFVRDEFHYESVAFNIGATGIQAGWLELIIPGVFLLIFFHTALHIFRKSEAASPDF